MSPSAAPEASAKSDLDEGGSAPAAVATGCRSGGGVVPGWYLAKKGEKITKVELTGNLLAEDFGWGDMDKDGFITQEEYETIYDEQYTEDYGLTVLELDALNPGAEPEVLWRYRGKLPAISSPLVYRGIVYFADQRGYVTSLNADSGELLKSERIPGAGTQYFASPVAADGKIYFAGATGKISVLQAGADWVVLSVSGLGERITATPVIGNDRLYVRTKSALYCFSDGS